MASNAVARSCIRSLRQHARHARIERGVSSRSLTQATFSPASKPQPKIPTSALTRTYASGPSTAVQGNATAAQDQEGVNQEDEAQDNSDFTEQYIAKEATETLFKQCARQADYIVPQAFERDGEVPKNAGGEDIGQGSGWWYEKAGLTPTFNIWFQITSLHLYLLIVRFRYLSPSRASIWQQHLTDHFFYEAEHRMTLFHKITSRGIRNRYLKDLYNQWRGVQGAYDEGLVKGDAVLATAIWRNVFKGDENVDWRNVALVTSFVRRAMKGLDGAKDDTIRRAAVKFRSGPGDEGPVIDHESRGLNAPWEKEDNEAWAEWEKKVEKGESKT